MKRKCSVPEILLTTHTWRTSCGSAVMGLLSMMFSMGRVKTLPLASQAREVGGSVGRTRRMGPERSVGASAVTQLSSSVGFSASSGSATLVDFLSWREEEGASSSSELAGSVVVVRLRFLGFLSPLKERGLTIVAGVVGVCCGGGGMEGK